MKISDIRKYDSKKMYEAYEKWPEIAQESYKKDLPKIHFKSNIKKRSISLFSNSLAIDYKYGHTDIFVDRGCEGFLRKYLPVVGFAVYFTDFSR